MLRIIASLLLGAALAPALAFAQDGSAAPPANDDAGEARKGEIIVQGYTQEDVREFLYGAIVESSDTIARRDRPICLGIDNVPAELVDLLTRRIAANLAPIGLKLAEPGCRINTAVVFHRDAHGFVQWLDRKQPAAFGALYKPEKRRIIGPARAAYNWHYIGRDARQAEANRQAVPFVGSRGGGLFAPNGGGFDGLKASRVVVGAPTTYSDVSFTVIDLDAIDGLTIEQIGDYLTMQMLVEFKPGFPPDTPGDSILTLFGDRGANPDAPPEMSPLDRAVLAELYSGQQNRSAGWIRAAIARRTIAGLDEKGLIRAKDEAAQP